MLSDLGCWLIRLLCGATANWVGCAPERKQRIYFANHTSNLDFLVLWCALPADVRAVTRPVAARDYWEKGRIRPFLTQRVFNALLIERRHVTRQSNPLPLLLAALEAGYSLIIFPEGGRSMDGTIKPFKSGIHHLTKRATGVEFIPAYLENLNRILPKGEVLPVPLLASVTFGAPLEIIEGELKVDFLQRARAAVEALAQQ